MLSNGVGLPFRDNELHVLSNGMEVYVQGSFDANGRPTDDGIVGPTLTMQQLRNHIADGSLWNWLASRQSGDDTLTPHFTQYLFATIAMSGRDNLWNPIGG